LGEIKNFLELEIRYSPSTSVTNAVSGYKWGNRHYSLRAVAAFMAG
jgi:hypothetical protein